jgi:homoserine/homoserine lactone efflux protein
MALSTLLLFSASSVALAITPGPTTLLALSNGITGGRRDALAGIAGATLASLLLIGAVALGLGAVLAASHTLFNLIRVAGIIYLCWLGIKLWRAQPLGVDGALAQSAGKPASAPKRAFLRSASVALSNPKTLLFFSAFLPQFIDPAQALPAQYMTLAAIFIAIDAAVMLAYATAGLRIVRTLSARCLRLINRGCAGAMFALAFGLALFQRSN